MVMMPIMVMMMVMVLPFHDDLGLGRNGRHATEKNQSKQESFHNMTVSA
jgi:hypothetical protein